MSEAVVDLLASRWGNLSHPDGTPTALAGYTTSTLPKQHAEVVGKAGQRLAESIVNTVEAEGYTFVRNDDLATLQNRATEVSQGDPIRVTCMLCGAALFTFTMASPGVVQTNPGVIAKALDPNARQCELGCPSRSVG